MAETTPVTGTPGGAGRTVRNLVQLIKKYGQKAWDKLTDAQKKAARIKHLGPGDVKLSKKHPTGRAVRAMRKEQKRQIEGAFD